MTNNYTVERITRTEWGNDFYTTLAEAETKARAEAWKNGEDYSIFQVIAVAKTPQLVNEVQIVKVD